MHLSMSRNTTNEAHRNPIPGNWKQQDEPATVAVRLLPNQHFQHMRTPATTLDGERSYETNGWP